MLLEADAKGLEVVVAFWLSKDKVGCQEILDKVDIHGNNQTRFGLPERLVAKKFIFRLLYGGQAFTYANDPEFSGVSNSARYWQKVIDEFYEKYQGVYNWHKWLMQEVGRTGKLVMPTGRVYEFTRNRFGDLPRNEVLNYPVQGTAADLMSIGRVLLYRRLRAYGSELIKPVSTIHDSILLDLPASEVESVALMIHESFRDIPRNFNTRFGSNLTLPLTAEIKVGQNWGNMVELK